MKYSLQSYRAIVEQALASGYRFKPFTLKQDEGAKCIYLRHDVDYSLDMGLELARVNAELGVAGTFFLLLQSQIYNLLSHRSQHIVRQLHGLGQHIGLHYALPPFPVGDLETRLRDDFQFIRRQLPMLTPVFTWHNPTHELLADSLQSDHVAGLINGYGPRFTRDITYLSDSNMRHTADHFLHVVRAGVQPALHLLFHPLIWVAGGASMRDVFARTWPYIIRANEEEMLSNRCYQGMFASGMPDAVLQTFVDQWLRAAEVGDR